MSALFSPRALSVLEAPLRVADGRARVGPALWLYIYLLVHVSHQGRLCRKCERVAAELGVDQAQVESWVLTLSDAGLVTILNPSPYLVVKLTLWPSDAGNRAPEQGVSEDSYSSSAIAAISNQGEKGVQGGGEGLLAEILDTLGETNPASFEGAVRNFPPDVIRRALARVRAARSIRKNRTALFRHLLGQLSRRPAS